MFIFNIHNNGEEVAGLVFVFSNFLLLLFLKDQLRIGFKTEYKLYHVQFIDS